MQKKKSLDRSSPIRKGLDNNMVGTEKYSLTDFNGSVQIGFFKMDKLGDLQRALSLMIKHGGNK